MSPEFACPFLTVAIYDIRVDIDAEIVDDDVNHVGDVSGDVGIDIDVNTLQPFCT